MEGQECLLYPPTPSKKLIFDHPTLSRVVVVAAAAAIVVVVVLVVVVVVVVVIVVVVEW